MRRAALLFAAALLLAGCGSATRPQLEHADAAGLSALAGRIASEGACAQVQDIPKLHARAVALVNARRVPQSLQEPLLSAVNALAAEQPVCLPSVPASSTTPTVTTPAPPFVHPRPPGHWPWPQHGHRGHGHGHSGHGDDR